MPSAAELVVQREDLEFVAWNDARREDHRIALPQTDRRMIAIGDTRQCCALFALATGAEIQHASRRQLSGFGFIKRWRKIREIARLFRGGDHLVHRPSDKRDLTPMLARGLSHGVETRDVGGKRRHGDASLEGTDQRRQGLPHARF